MPSLQLTRTLHCDIEHTVSPESVVQVCFQCLSQQPGFDEVVANLDCIV
jgi:hypothetical protein